MLFFLPLQKMVKFLIFPWKKTLFKFDNKSSYKEFVGEQHLVEGLLFSVPVHCYILHEKLAPTGA